FALDEFTDKMRFLPGKGFVYRLAMDATRQGDFQKAAILFKAINRNKPLNGSAMNSPPTPPYCGSVAAALHLINSQIRCGSCREKVLFIALRWMQPDRGVMWQAENPELAREFPAGTASKALQSRVHPAQGVCPVFVFHSFVQCLNISRASCSKKVCRVSCRVLTRWCRFFLFCV
ncbi:MAG: hypothetical protein PUD98_02140, partial [Bacteroidales bacterium]|nr:hypothetical protein [Bacteroidales bacterium]